MAYFGLSIEYRKLASPPHCALSASALCGIKRADVLSGSSVWLSLAKSRDIGSRVRVFRGLMLIKNLGSFYFFVRLLIVCLGGRWRSGEDGVGVLDLYRAA